MDDSHVKIADLLLRSPDQRPKRRITAQRISAAAAATCLVLVSACSGDAGGSTDVAIDCDSPGVTANAVRIGLIQPDTGALAPVLASARGAVQARVDLQNSMGGVHGREIVIDWRDDASEPAVNLTQAVDLVERAGVFALLQTTTAASGSEDYLEQAGIPVVGMATDFTWANHRNMVSHTYVYSEQNSVDTFGQYVRQLGGSNAFVVKDFTDSDSTLSRTITRSVESQGIPIVARRDFLATADSPDRLAQEIRASGADVLVGALSGPSFAEVVSAVNRMGIPLKAILGISGYDQGLLRKYGAGLAGMSVYIPYTPFETDTPALTQYRDAITRFAPEIATPDNEGAISSYIAADVLVQGLVGAGDCPTRESFLNSLRGTNDYDGAGLLPAPVDLGTNFDSLTQCYYFVRVNEAGTAFERQRRPGATDDSWCGSSI